RESRPKQIGGKPRPRPDFQKILPQIHAVQRPWEHLFLKRRLPTPRPASPTMIGIHLSSIPVCREFQRATSGRRDPAVRQIDDPVPVLRVPLVMSYLDNRRALVV